MKAIDPLIRTTDEIVADIIRALDAAAAIKPTVLLAIDGLRQLSKYPPLTGYRKDNERFAQRLKKWADDGNRLFADAPKDFNLHMLFAPENCGPLNSREGIEAMARQAAAGYAALTGWLAHLRSKCDWIIQNKIGEHRHAGINQERVAIAARELCERVGKPLAYSSPTSAYRIVAGLLYEAMTGEQGRDMERACEFIAQTTIVTATERR